MPKWIHDRAMSLKDEMEKTYGPEKAEQVAFAVATQMAHRTGKSPKTFVSEVTGKKERFGTPEGRREAKQKFDKPLKEYQKTAEARWKTMMRTGKLGKEEVEKLLQRGTLDIERESAGFFKGVDALGKKHLGEGFLETMGRLKHLSEGRVKTAEEAMDTILETNEQSTSGEQPHLDSQTDFTPDVVNDVAATIHNADKRHKERFNDLSKIMDNIGEKKTFQREEVVNNPTADKPDTPNIKVSSDVMWASFFNELQKIAQGGSSISDTIQDLIKGDGPASTDVRLPHQRTVS